MTELYAVNNSFYTPLVNDDNNPRVTFFGSDFFDTGGDSAITQSASNAQGITIPNAGTLLLTQLILTNNEGVNINFGQVRFYIALLDVDNFLDGNLQPNPVAYDEVNLGATNIAAGQSERFGIYIGKDAENALVSKFEEPAITTTPTGDYAGFPDTFAYKTYFSKRMGFQLRTRNNVAGRDFTATFISYCIGVN